MEELKKLEEAQRMITLMESHALLSSSSSNNRFLANLFLLLIQQCGDLDFKDKLSLINQHLPKVITLLFNFSCHINVNNLYDTDYYFFARFRILFSKKRRSCLIGKKRCCKRKASLLLIVMVIWKIWHWLAWMPCNAQILLLRIL